MPLMVKPMSMAIEDHNEVQLQGIHDAELLIFDLP